MFRVQRAVESAVKRREIEKSRAALEARAEAGHDQGRPPFGLTFDDAGEQWILGDQFADALNVIEARERGLSWRDVVDETGVPKDTARRVYDRRERYHQEAN